MNVIKFFKASYLSWKPFLVKFLLFLLFLTSVRPHHLPWCRLRSGYNWVFLNKKKVKMYKINFTWKRCLRINIFISDSNITFKKCFRRNATVWNTRVLPLSCIPGLVLLWVVVLYVIVLTGPLTRSFWECTIVNSDWISVFCEKPQPVLSVDCDFSFCQLAQI